MPAKVSGYERSCIFRRHGNGDAKKALYAKRLVVIWHVETSNVGKGKVIASFTFAQETDDFGNGCLELFGRHQMFISVQTANFFRHRLLEPPSRIPEPRTRINSRINTQWDRRGVVEHHISPNVADKLPDIDRAHDLILEPGTVYLTKCQQKSNAHCGIRRGSLRLASMH